MIVHCVLMRLRPGVAEADLAALTADLLTMREGVEGYLDFSAGRENGFEGLARGWDFGFVVRFRDDAARQAYHAHPRYDAVAERLLGLCDGGMEGVMVFDYDWPDPVTAPR